MDKHKLINLIEKFAPIELQESWDCSGWIVEKNEIFDIKKVMLALTITDAVLKQALDNNCDMIISHHPLFNVPIDYKKIEMYCAHTNLDKTQGGTTDTLIDILNFDVKFFENEGFVRYIELKEKIYLSSLLGKLKKVSPHLRYSNKKNKKIIRKIALCAGSGSEFINKAEEKGFDAYITGDVKYHTAVDSNLILIDVGHFESEIPVLKTIEKILNNKIEVIYAKEKTPFLHI